MDSIKDAHASPQKVHNLVVSEEEYSDGKFRWIAKNELLGNTFVGRGITPLDACADFDNKWIPS